MNDGGFFFDVCQESLCYLIAYFLADLPSVVTLFQFQIFLFEVFLHSVQLQNKYDMHEKSTV